MASVIFTLGITVAAKVIGDRLIEQQLIPLVETELDKFLQRPLDIGKLKSWSLLSASFGRSELVATADNPDTLTAQEVKVNFKLIPLLLRRKLPLEIVLIEPSLYVEQDEQGIWTPTDFGTGESSEGGIKVIVNKIKLQQGQLQVLGRDSETKELSEPVVANFSQGVVNFFAGGEQAKFTVTGGELAAGGKLQVTGEVVGSVIDLDLKGQDIGVKQVENLLALPIGLESGTADGNLQIKITDSPTPELNGIAQLQDMAMQIPGLTQPFSQSNGRLFFAGSEIEFDGVKTNFGEVKGEIQGSIDIDRAGNYDIQAQTDPIAADKVLTALELESPVPITGDITGEITMTGELEDPVTKFAVATTTPTKIDRLDFASVRGDLELIGDTMYVRGFNGLPVSGGELTGTGTIELADTQNIYINLKGRNLNSAQIAQDYNTELPVAMGRTTANVFISALANDPSSFRIIDGRGYFGLGGGTVAVDNLKYAWGNWRSQIRANQVRFDSLPFGQDTVDTVAAGLVSGTFQATGEINDPTLATLVAQGQAEVTTVGGLIEAPEITIAEGIWQGDFVTGDLALRKLFTDVPPEFSDRISGEFFLSGNVTTPEGEPSKIQGQGDLALAQGIVQVKDLEVVGEDWKAIATAQNLELKQLNSATPEQFAGLVNGEFQLSGTIDNITPEGIVAQGDGSLTLPEGVFSARDLAIANGNFTTRIIPEGVDLQLFADPNSDDFILEGYLGGELTASGKIEQIDPTAIQAQGKVSFSQGIDLLEQPFSADIIWNGSRLEVLKARGDGLNATGYFELDPSFFDEIPDKLAAVNDFNFQVAQAKGIDINRLKLTLPSWAVNLERSGFVDFRGTLGGVPAQMAIKGDLRLRNFQVETLNFPQALTGQVLVDPAVGVDLDLTGSDREAIALKLDRDFLPQSFNFQLAEIAVTGQGKAEILQLQVSQFPLELLKTIALKSPDFEIPEQYATQPIAGELSGDFTSNLNTLATAGENVVVTSPLLGKVKGSRVEGEFQYADGYIALQDVRFQQGNSNYKLTGDVVQTADDLQLNGAVSIEQGQIQDILVALEVFELTDLGQGLGGREYAKSADLYPSPASNTDSDALYAIEADTASIWQQLTLLSQIQAWLNQKEQARKEASILPELKNLQGLFNGTINVTGSLEQGLDARFDFEGTDWQWASKNTRRRRNSEKLTVAEKIILKGDYRNEILTILPLIVDLPDLDAVTSENSRIIFSGSFGGEEASGRLALETIPIDLIERVVTLPPEVTVDGVLSANANISGTTDNPKARGEIEIADARINETAIRSASGSFGYDDARLNFSANSVVAQDAQPLALTGSIPYQLPFANAEPASDDLQVSLNMEDKALTLLNILTRGEVNWIDGGGKVALDISGKLDRQTSLPKEIIAKGRATIEDGTIAVRSLPDAYLRNVESQIDFNLDRISVETFTGDFGGGQISAVGTLPLDEATNSEDPLTIDLDDLAIDLKGLYQGGVKGQVQVLGKAFEPDITGEIALFDGTILLSDATTAVPLTPEEEQQQLGLPSVTEYKNLKLELGEKVFIAQPPIFNFLAEGSLNVGGTFLEPLPEGTIKLERGQVNLFTTQLFLAKGEEHTARFSSSNLLDPFLDVRLVGSAIEATQNRTPEDPNSTEIEDIPASRFGTLETVRISAEVRGLASQITNRLVLSSSPPRSQTEILALLGGSFVNTLGRGDSTLSLANLAGSALFGSLNSEVSNIFPFAEFRLFPTQIIAESESERERLDALAGEVAIDVTDRFSFSALKILNVGEIPAQFGVRYRLNENFILRGSSNFEDDTRGVLEYELRF